MKKNIPRNVYADRRKDGKYVLIEMTGLSRSSSTSQLWKPAKLPNGRGRQFDNSAAAYDWAEAWQKAKDESE